MHTSIFTKYLISNISEMTRSEYLGAKITLFIINILAILLIVLSLTFLDYLFPNVIFSFIGFFLLIGLLIFTFISSTALDVYRFRNIGYPGYLCLLIIAPSILVTILSKINEVNNDLMIDIFIVTLALIGLVAQLLLFFKKGKNQT